ncbi:hypothetical protein HLB23_36505 [Nocardia uniformis]|uniref:Uncharacterized protein n=1 Tax=Nocardia uniformis TaxID=53432 RepID=A0A849C903_9NOCA|nr:hypothetical protein [Nocardia uniformis]NNH75293.1 hypothetical protein [Nocardia uniformis]
MALFQADIDQINALAKTLGEVAAQIDAIDVRTAAQSIAAALPGTPLGAACAQATEYTEGAWWRVSQRVEQVSTAMTAVAADVAATDDTFRHRLDGLDFRTGGR